MSLIESTYKARETEEWLDIKFYRPLGYLIARACKKIKVTPNAISFTGMFLGVLAGWLFYYSEFRLTLAGILLLIVSEAMDSADGQLARMTNRKSRFGRVLDGFVTNIIFLSIYISLCLRTALEGSQLVWLVALLSALSHSLQSAVADHYRNGYLHFVVSPGKSELDMAERIGSQYRRLKWKKEPFQKFWTLLYLNYTREQEMISPKFSELRQKTEEFFDGILPQRLSQMYSEYTFRQIKFYNILTTNTRMICLFVSLIIGIPWIYFAFEILVLNGLLLHVVIYHEMASDSVLKKIKLFEKEKQEEEITVC
ncbi:MAG: CDP-alcohol phosphatidyltransferase family protein [Ignavibacteria bacterium]|jgi:hypothetical protein|nr:CDP-alcohol phosphatidyltransferase family protein [Ignavibacteria bacterium]MCU7502913.1 CDP-alcohol phosphatidyltransferase family protein [Ignavibacteria bacterium]MCU7515593.1 CDP-alcohol phosphatidyltransferase family protein [Ignavibacteria bacterium]